MPAISRLGYPRAPVLGYPLDVDFKAKGAYKMQAWGRSTYLYRATPGGLQRLQGKRTGRPRGGSSGPA